VLHRLSGRPTHIFGHPTTRAKRRQQHPPGNTKIRDEGQTIQMRIPPKRIRIPRIYPWTRRVLNRPSQDTGPLGLDSPQENEGRQMLPRFLQLLPMIYGRFQQASQTTIRKNEERLDQQMGMVRKRTGSIRRTKNKTHHSTSTGVLRPSHTNHNRNRHLEIPLLQYTISTMPAREIEASGIAIQDNVGRGMQLRYTRQGITGNSSDTSQRETMHAGKSKTGPGPHGQQKLRNLYDDEGTQ